MEWLYQLPGLKQLPLLNPEVGTLSEGLTECQIGDDFDAGYCC